MGNTRIVDSRTGKIMGLHPGFVPVGMKEHGGVLYIASVNQNGECELGSIPSPIITYHPSPISNSTESKVIIRDVTGSDKDVSLLAPNINQFLVPENRMDCDLHYLSTSREFNTGDAFLVFIDLNDYSTVEYNPDINIDNRNQVATISLVADTEKGIIPIDTSDITLKKITKPKNRYIETELAKGQWFLKPEDDLIDDIQVYIKRDCCTYYPNITSGKLAIRFLPCKISNFGLGRSEINNELSTQINNVSIPTDLLVSNPELEQRRATVTIGSFMFQSDSAAKADALYIHVESNSDITGTYYNLNGVDIPFSDSILIPKNLLQYNRVMDNDQEWWLLSSIDGNYERSETETIENTGVYDFVNYIFKIVTNRINTDITFHVTPLDTNLGVKYDSVEYTYNPYWGFVDINFTPGLDNNGIQENQLYDVTLPLSENVTPKLNSITEQMATNVKWKVYDDKIDFVAQCDEDRWSGMKNNSYYAISKMHNNTGENPTLHIVQGYSPISSSQITDFNAVGNIPEIKNVSYLLRPNVGNPTVNVSTSELKRRDGQFVSYPVQFTQWGNLVTDSSIVEKGLWYYDNPIINCVTGRSQDANAKKEYKYEPGDYECWETSLGKFNNNGGFNLSFEDLTGITNLPIKEGTRIVLKDASFAVEDSTVGRVARYDTNHNIVGKEWHFYPRDSWMKDKNGLSDDYMFWLRYIELFKAKLTGNFKNLVGLIHRPSDSTEMLRVWIKPLKMKYPWGYLYQDHWELQLTHPSSKDCVKFLTFLPEKLDNSSTSRIVVGKVTTYINGEDIGVAQQSATGLKPRSGNDNWYQEISFDELGLRNDQGVSAVFNKTDTELSFSFSLHQTTPDSRNNNGSGFGDDRDTVSWCFASLAGNVYIKEVNQLLLSNQSGYRIYPMFILGNIDENRYYGVTTVNNKAVLKQTQYNNTNIVSLPIGIKEEVITGSTILQKKYLLQKDTQYNLLIGSHNIQVNGEYLVLSLVINGPAISKNVYFSGSVTLNIDGNFLIVPFSKILFVSRTQLNIYVKVPYEEEVPKNVSITNCSIKPNANTYITSIGLYNWDHTYQNEQSIDLDTPLFQDLWSSETSNTSGDATTISRSATITEDYGFLVKDWSNIDDPICFFPDCFVLKENAECMNLKYDQQYWPKEAFYKIKGIYTLSNTNDGNPETCICEDYPDLNGKIIRERE